MCRSSEGVGSEHGIIGGGKIRRGNTVADALAVVEVEIVLGAASRSSKAVCLVLKCAHMLAVNDQDMVRHCRDSFGI